VERKRGLRLVKSASMAKKQADPDLPIVYFRPNEAVPETGIYQAYHGDHRSSHLVTLLAGSDFPVCKVCGPEVHFRLVRGVPSAEESGFQVKLYEVPHPQEEEEGSQVA